MAAAAPPSIQVGQRVMDKNGFIGTVRYVGPVPTSKKAETMYAGAGALCCVHAMPPTPLPTRTRQLPAGHCVLLCPQAPAYPCSAKHPHAHAHTHTHIPTPAPMQPLAHRTRRVVRPPSNPCVLLLRAAVRLV